LTKVITRRLNFKKYWCTTNAVETGFESPYSPKWSNTFYIHFCKDDFPKLNYPEYIDGRFKYFSDNDIESLPFHKGITFYEETIHKESGKTYVKAGCDFQHLNDDIYWQDDNGEMILNNLSKEVGEAFERIVKNTETDSSIEKV